MEISADFIVNSYPMYLKNIISKRQIFLVAIRNNSSAAALERHGGLKSKEFYEEASRKRNYFYIIDLKGQLHLEDSKYRNFTTCSKDQKFLSFFFRHLRVNDSGIEPAQSLEGGQKRSVPEPYPYLSTCGQEINFVSHEDPFSALGFVGLEETGNTAELIYPGGVAKELLNPTELSFNSTTGRLYHSISALPHLAGCQGLLHPSLCQRFADLIVCDAVTGLYFFDWQAQRHPLKIV